MPGSVVSTTGLLRGTTARMADDGGGLLLRFRIDARFKIFALVGVTERCRGELRPDVDGPITSEPWW